MNLATTIRHLIIGRLRWLLASGDERDAEILALRHQILVLQRQLNRPRFTDADRTILAVLSTVVARSRLAQIMLIVQPKTVIAGTVDSSPASELPHLRRNAADHPVGAGNSSGRLTWGFALGG